MKPLKNFGKFLKENTLFNPGNFEEELKDIITKKPTGSIYIEKQLALGTISHMKMIAKKLGLHVVSISAHLIDDGGKSLGIFLTEEPVSKTLVIFDDMEMAKEKTINFIEDLVETRNYNGKPISDLYYFAEVHLIDRSIENYKRRDIHSVFYEPAEAGTQLIRKSTDNTP